MPEPESGAGGRLRPATTGWLQLHLGVRVLALPTRKGSGLPLGSPVPRHRGLRGACSPGCGSSAAVGVLTAAAPDGPVTLKAEPPAEPVSHAYNHPATSAASVASAAPPLQPGFH